MTPIAGSGATSSKTVQFDDRDRAVVAVDRDVGAVSAQRRDQVGGNGAAKVDGDRGIEPVDMDRAVEAIMEPRGDMAAQKAPALGCRASRLRWCDPQRRFGREFDY